MSYICTSQKSGSERAIFLIMWFFVFGVYYVAATKIIFNKLYTHSTLMFVICFFFLTTMTTKTTTASTTPLNSLTPGKEI